MPSFKERATERVEDLRKRRPFVDHLVRMVQHYGEIKGNIQAGAVTYFAFLSFFPILALAFFVIGYVARVYPEAEADLIEAIDGVLPGIVGTGDGQISLDQIQDAAGAVGLIGLLGVIYAGLGWLSAMRDALLVVFELPDQEKPNFVIGKARDLISLLLIGVVLVVSVAVAGFVRGSSDTVLDWVGLGSELGWLLVILTVVVGLGANMLLFFALFKLLANPHAPKRSLWAGALLGAVGFEVLKQLSTFLIASTKDQPAFQAFGIALILLVWINYFSRVVMYAAAWAHTSREARGIRDAEQAAEEERIARNRVELRKLPPPEEAGKGSLVKAFAAGGVSAIGLIAVLRRRQKEDA